MPRIGETAVAKIGEMLQIRFKQKSVAHRTLSSVRLQRTQSLPVSFVYTIRCMYILHVNLNVYMAFNNLYNVF